MTLPKGQFVRLTGENLKLEVDFDATTFASADITIGGSVSVSQFTDTATAARRTTVAFANGEGTYTDGDGVVYGVTDARGVVILYDSGNPADTTNGIVGQIEVTATGGAGPFSGTATGVIRLNTTSRVSVNEAVSIAGAVWTLSFDAANVNEIAIADATLSYDPYLTIEGTVESLNTQALTDSGATSGIAGRNITIFLGDKGDLADETDDVGLLLTNTQLAIFEFGTSAERSFAIYAEGDVSVIGIDGLRIEGRVQIWINNSGRIFNTTVTSVPRLDPSETLAPLAVKFTSGAMEQVLGNVLIGIAAEIGRASCRERV